MTNIDKKMRIKGIVLCPCGGQVISNSGKIMGGTEKGKISCWSCGKEFDMGEAFKQRQEGETVVFDPEEE